MRDNKMFPGIGYRSYPKIAYECMKEAQNQKVLRFFFCGNVAGKGKNEKMNRRAAKEREEGCRLPLRLKSNRVSVGIFILLRYVFAESLQHCGHLCTGSAALGIQRGFRHALDHPCAAGPLHGDPGIQRL